MKPSRTFSLLAVLISAVAVSGQQGASGGSSPADIVYAQPGKLVSVNGFRLNLYCMGSGSPTVVFDSGWGDWAPAWSKVQPQIAKWARACSYDRAGTGFSDPGPMPRTSVRIAEELRTALHHAGIAGPYILVGSAFGGDNVRTFADLYMGEVAGLVLVDADPTDVAPKAMQEEEHRGHASIPSDLRDCRNAIAEHKPLPAQDSGPGRPQRTCAQQFFFRGLPEAEWSPELNAKVLEIAQTKVAMYDAYSSEMEHTASDETYLQQHRRSFGSRPIRVLTSGNHGVGHLERKPPDTPEHLKYEQETTLAQARWLTLSSNAKQIFAHNSSEYIQFDEPETVINAVREVYDQTRRSVAAHRKPGQIAPVQQATILDADEYLQQYLDAARSKPAAERPALYAKYVYEPVLKICGEGGEYYEFGKYNLIRPITNLDALANEIATLSRAQLFRIIKSALRKSAKLLPGPSATVCVLAADPDVGYVRTDLHGVAGYTFGAGKILLQVAPVADWKQWLPYTVAHEYHHSAWTWRHYRAQENWTLLHSIIFEGKADAFAHSVFPKQTAPWVSTLTPGEEVAVWPKMKPELATTDFRVNQKFLFGREGVPKLAGYTIGFHIVESYLKTHPAATIAEWSALDEQQLLDNSGYGRAAGPPGTVLRDCPECPEMVVIPAGKFTIGSPASEKSWAASHGGTLGSVADESPQHAVSLKSFALGKYHVTRGEYAAFVRETGYSGGDGCYESSMPKSRKQAGTSWQNPGFNQSDRDPVVCVSWQDARAYISWLNGRVRRSGSASDDGPYRLPSEAEWEYAARAGTTTPFWWGDNDSGASGHAWFKSNSGGQTHPVGLKPANAFGLYDMVGNVWQWTQDCYAESYANAPADGQPNETGDACLRVDRGSSWLYPAWLLRSATRERNPAGYRDVIMGFRLARTLP